MLFDNVKMLSIFNFVEREYSFYIIYYCFCNRLNIYYNNNGYLYIEYYVKGIFFVYLGNFYLFL